MACTFEISPIFALISSRRCLTLAAAVEMREILDPAYREGEWRGYVSCGNSSNLQRAPCSMIIGCGSMRPCTRAHLTSARAVVGMNDTAHDSRWETMRKQSMHGQGKKHNRGCVKRDVWNNKTVFGRHVMNLLHHSASSNSILHTPSHKHENIERAMCQKELTVVYTC